MKTQLIVSLALLFGTTSASAQEARQETVLRVQLEQALAASDPALVLTTIDNFHKLPEATPDFVHFIEAQASLQSKQIWRAEDALRRYLFVADPSDPKFAEGLKLYGQLVPVLAADIAATEPTAETFHVYLYRMSVSMTANEINLAALTEAQQESFASIESFAPRLGGSSRDPIFISGIDKPERRAMFLSDLAESLYAIGEHDRAKLFENQAWAIVNRSSESALMKANYISVLAREQLDRGEDVAARAQFSRAVDYLASGLEGRAVADMPNMINIILGRQLKDQYGLVDSIEKLEAAVKKKFNRKAQRFVGGITGSWYAKLGYIDEAEARRTELLKVQNDFGFMVGIVYNLLNVNIGQALVNKGQTEAGVEHMRKYVRPEITGAMSYVDFLLDNIDKASPAYIVEAIADAESTGDTYSLANAAKLLHALDRKEDAALALNATINDLKSSDYAIGPESLPSSAVSVAHSAAIFIDRLDLARDIAALIDADRPGSGTGQNQIAELALDRSRKLMRDGGLKAAVAEITSNASATNHEKLIFSLARSRYFDLQE